jgi:hypothetical protein
MLLTGCDRLSEAPDFQALLASAEGLTYRAQRLLSGGHIDAQFEQLAVDLGSAPQRVLNTHSSDQIAHLFADPWPATARAGFPSPVRGEAHSMPTHSSFGPDDGYGVKNARTATIEPNEQGAVGPTQMQSAWCALLQDIELMPHQDFGFQPPPRRPPRPFDQCVEHCGIAAVSNFAFSLDWV